MTDGSWGLPRDLIPVAGEVVIGDVVEFDEARGLGSVEFGVGRLLPFHCTAITDGSRRITPGTVVAFEVVAGRLGRLEARSIRPLPGVMPGATLGQVVPRGVGRGVGGVRRRTGWSRGSRTSLDGGAGGCRRWRLAGRPRRCDAPVGNAAGRTVAREGTRVLGVGRGGTAVDVRAGGAGGVARARPRSVRGLRVDRLRQSPLLRPRRGCPARHGPCRRRPHCRRPLRSRPREGGPPAGR